jgi:hypothetical protein
LLLVYAPMGAKGKTRDIIFILMLCYQFETLYIRIKSKIKVTTAEMKCVRLRS